MTPQTANRPAASRALIAMSGGVDSSVAALLMQRAGYDCTGVTMKLYDNEAIGEPAQATCCTQADADDARSVCARLHIPFYTFNFAADFAAQVIDPFIAAYRAGATPNPCIACNRHLKFARLLRRTLELGYHYMATGHYARVDYAENTGRHLLKRATDLNKDQSYVLYTLTQEQLAHLRLPLGALTQDEVRRIAAEAGFVTADKHESQDICFVPDGDYAGFIDRYTAHVHPHAAGTAAASVRPGVIRDIRGNVLGEHAGVERFTIGQRKGIGIASSEPYYVVAIDAVGNTVTVGREADLFSQTAIVCDVNLIDRPVIAAPLQVQAKHRYRTPASPAVVEQLDADRLRVRFEQPQRAITPGQALVLYDGEIVVGGGTIANCGANGDGFVLSS
jgi:tRNA-specific 2-thiouridylase